MRHQKRRILTPLGKRRQMDRNDIQTVEKVVSEPPHPHQILEIPLGGRNHPRVHASGHFIAHSLELLVLQHPEELDLEIQGDVINLIQKEGATVRQLKTPPSVLPSFCDSQDKKTW